MGAITICIPRLIGVILGTTFAYVTSTACQYGVKLEEGKYYTGWRRPAIQKFILWGATINRMFLGISLEIKKVSEDEADYSHYLGKDYKTTQKLTPGEVPTIIAPHVS